MEKLLRRKAELKLKKVRPQPNCIFSCQIEPFLGFGEFKKKTGNIQILMDSNFLHSTHSYFKQRDGLTQSRIPKRERLPYPTITVTIKFHVCLSAALQLLCPLSSLHLSACEFNRISRCYILSVQKLFASLHPSFARRLLCFCFMLCFRFNGYFAI